MTGCPFHDSNSQQSPAGDRGHIAKELAFLAEANSPAEWPERMVACREALAQGEPAPLTSSELTWAGRIAWRNHSRCIGRLYWRSLNVRDHRHLDTAEEIASSLAEHLRLAQGTGGVRSILTVFAPHHHTGRPSPRIWNAQLCGYAGYRHRDGTILGDPKNAELTAQALALGWQAPAERGRFDLLPWIIAVDGKPQLFALPPGLVQEVRLRHPRFPWFEQLGLRWYAVPVISDMRLRAAATDFPAAPFNGWYMGTEIGARDLADEYRYNQIPVIAEKMGLDTSTPRNLWKDRALLELNAAVLYSYERDGVKLVDHHTASAEFMMFCKREREAGREVSARWDWIVPPMSPATMEVFHTTMREFPMTPDFQYQPPGWV